MPDMRCDSCREQLSADLDGQADDPVLLCDALDHRDSCPDCQAWYVMAADVNRLVRMAPASPSPAVPASRLEAILAELPTSGRPSRRRIRRRAHYAARVTLALTGLVQTVWGGLSLLADNSMGDAMSDMPADGMIHMSHEYSSWVMALGVAFVVGAGYVRHLAGVLPALGCFVGLLGIVSVTDLVHHEVNPTHVASHALLVFAFVLILVILRTGPTDRPGRRTALPLGRPLADPGRRGGPSDADRDRTPPARDPAARHRAA
ncbi:MAG TPA: hypothetical protein VGH89_34005 [Pseudonocardia sp.]